ncbi:NHLP-related RiPP peptide [Xanthomonas translucens pv. poae]|uniref:NHLP-related RiPP peptide n=1 Tax=Xanthomonas graminis TaxID=3390026 RepID=UPI0009BA0833|nr:NHLP-related RiPP peptide [Xanthomonas translucens]UKE62239.1 NHLP-related RiPP peptide [Xanthomonas translucens pv. poae]
MSQNVEHIPFSEEAAFSLIDRLSSDEDFRNLFVTDPAKALRDAGVPEQIVQATVGEGKCLDVKNLAPKEELAAAKSLLLEYLTSKSAYHVVHCFESGKIDSTLRKK